MNRTNHLVSFILKYSKNTKISFYCEKKCHKFVENFFGIISSVRGTLINNLGRFLSTIFTDISRDILAIPSLS